VWADRHRFAGSPRMVGYWVSSSRVLLCIGGLWPG
jgi:hypothetical protein